MQILKICPELTINISTTVKSTNVSPCMGHVKMALYNVFHSKNVDKLKNYRYNRSIMLRLRQLVLRCSLLIMHRHGKRVK